MDSTVIQLHLFKRNHKIENLTGKTFGRWTVLAYGGENGHEMKLWWCRCACGTERKIQKGALTNGSTNSCGCLSGEMTTQRRQLPPGKSGFNRILTAYRCGAAKREISFDLTPAEFFNLTQGECTYCGTPPCRTSQNGKSEEFRQRSTFVYNGVDRVDSAKAYTLDNCVTCCAICNRAKFTLSREEFLAHIARIYKFNAGEDA